jgi:putative addiction module CopG family antidote
MNVNLSPAMKEFVDRKLQAGEYQSAEQVLEAGLAILQQQETRPDFAPGELDALIAVGEADIAAAHEPVRPLGSRQDRPAADLELHRRRQH